MKNIINKEYFSEYLKNYIQNIDSVKDCGYCQLPFIPYTFPRYNEIPLKVFYFGRDTCGWCEYDAMYNEMNEIDVSLYLRNNAQYVSVEKIREDWVKSGSFWGMVGHLHLQLLTGVYHDSINVLSESDWELLEGIGYGNLFSIETKETLKGKFYSEEKRSEYDDIRGDIPGYEKLVVEAKCFENLNSIFQAYGEPDIVFILSWREKGDFFEGLDYESLPQYYEEDYRAVYVSKTHKTIVIWSLHPNRYHFLGTNREEMCQYLCDTYNQTKKAGAK